MSTSHFHTQTRAQTRTQKTRPQTGALPRAHARLAPLCVCGDKTCPKRRLIEQEITRHGEQLRYIALNITRDMPLAEDLSQNLMVKILANPHCYNDEGLFLGFAKRVINNTYLNWIRDNKRYSSYDEMVDPARNLEARRVSVEDLMDLSADDEGFEELIQGDLLAQMRASVTGDTELKVLDMLCAGLGGVEIAERMEMNPNTVHGVIRRVRQSLFRQFPLELEAITAAHRRQRAEVA